MIDIAKCSIFKNAIRQCNSKHKCNHSGTTLVILMIANRELYFWQRVLAKPYTSVPSGDIFQGQNSKSCKYQKISSNGFDFNGNGKVGLVSYLDVLLLYFRSPIQLSTLVLYSFLHLLTHLLVRPRVCTGSNHKKHKKY